MAALLILYCIIFALVIVGTIGIFTIKNTILQKIVIFLMIILSMCIGYLAFTSFPDNEIFKKIFSLVLSILPLLFILLIYYKKINWFIFKIILVASMFATLIYSLI